MISVGPVFWHNSTGGLEFQFTDLRAVEFQLATISTMCGPGEFKTMVSIIQFNRGGEFESTGGIVPEFRTSD